MLTITKLGIATARDYFQKEFANVSNSYFSEQGAVRGRWSGQLGARSGAHGSCHRRSLSAADRRERSQDRRSVDPASRYLFNA